MSQFWFRDKLPFPWTYGVTRDGRVFFIDEEKRRTTWLHPTYGCAVQSGYISHPSLPEDWEMSMTDTGLLYYINHFDCTTTFHHPSEQMNEQTTASEFISPALANQTSIKRKASQSKTSERPPEAKRDFSAPIVLDGWLYRQESGIMKPWKKRWCVLSNLCLYCYEGENDKQCISSIILPGYRINSCRKSDPVTRNYAFKVEHRNTKTCYFAAEDEIEMNRWIEVLRSAATLQNGDPSIEQYPSTPGSLQRYSTQQLVDSYQEKENAWQDNVGRDVENDDAFWGRQNSRPDWESLVSNQNGISRPMDPDYPNVVLRQKTRNTDFPQTGQPSTYNFGNPLDAVDPISSSMPMNDPRRIDWEFQDSRFSTQQKLPDRQPANFNDDYSNMQNRQNVGPNQIHSSNQFIGLNSQHSVSSSRVNNELQRSFNQENNFRRQSASTGKLNDESQQYGSTRPAHNHPHIRQSYNYLNDNYTHEPHHRQMNSIHQDRVISPTGFQSTMGSFPGNQVMNNNKNELESPPERPPIPASLRDQYIDVLAETKTPKSRLDLFQSKEISHQKLTEPTYFQYPESPPTSQSIERRGFREMVDGRAPPKQVDLQQTPTGSKQFGLDQSGSNPRIRQVFQSGSNPHLSFNEARIPDSQSRVASLGMHGNPTYLRILQNSANDSNRHSEQLNQLNSENEISKTMDEMTSGRKNPRQELSDGPSSYSSKEFVPEPVLFNGPDAVRYAMSPGRKKENPMMAVNPIASRGIETIKEDPDMLDTDILTSRTLQDLQKHMAVHTRLRLSISVQDLVGKSHEELVLLLIQLRRSQTKLEEICRWAKSRSKEFQSQDQLNSQNSFSRTSDSINFPEMRKQVEELEKQIDVTQPLINLLDNMVTMGSLYNGDNLMYASQYKKNQLHPNQIVPEKKMIEFSRRHQEEQLTSKQESSMRQLTDDEINLEEKLKRLYELDGKLQETSFAVTSLQEDKAMLEKTLTGIRKSEDDEVNVVMLDRLQRQRQILETELTRVLKELADASKLFEETNAENVKVEQQVITLRNKVYSISRSQSSPSLASGSGHVIVKLEQELKQIQSVMEGLSTQGSKISEEIGNLKAPNSSGVVSTLQVKPSTYIETDLDSRVSRDISRPSPDRPDGVTMNQQVSSSSPFSAIANRYVTGASPARNSSTKLEYKLVPMNGESRSFGKDWNSSSSPSRGARSTGSMQSIPTNRTYSASIPAAHHGNNIAHSATNLTDITNGDDLMKRYYGILPKERSRSSVRDVKKREISRKAQAAGNYEIPNESSDARYSVLQRSRSLPRVSSGSNRESDFPGRQSTDDNSIQKSSFHTNLSRDDPSRSSAMQRLFPKQPSVGLQSNDSRNSSVSSRSRPTVSLSPMYSGSLPKFSSSVSPSVKTEVPKFVTVATVKPVPNTEVQRPSFTGHASESDRLSGFSNSWQSDSLGNNREVVKSEVVMDLNFDDNTIERAVFQPPQLVEIPARYVPDPRDENALTWEEKLQRKEKSDQIKKMLAVHSLQDYRQNELTPQTGTMREQVEAEKRQREQMLDIKQSLVEEVTQRSKQAALYRQQNMWSNTDS